MTHSAAVASVVRPEPAAASANWARRVNRLVREQLEPTARARTSHPAVLERIPAPAGNSHAGASIRFSDSAAESVVRQGLKATALGQLAEASGLDARLLYEFAGIDRTTVARRTARDDVLPHEVSVKALEFADLMATSTDVFGAVDAGARWLSKPHPVLDGETPLQRARTPWGAQRVRAMLGALKYGAAV